MLSEKQRGVLKGMIAGLAVTLAIVIGGSWLDPFALEDTREATARLMLAIEAAVLPAAFLVLSVGRLARHRFFTPQDIDGGGISTDSQQALVLQTLLQNTLEQFCIAVLAYLAWASVMPVAWLSVPGSPRSHSLLAACSSLPVTIAVRRPEHSVSR